MNAAKEPRAFATVLSSDPAIGLAWSIDGDSLGGLGHLSPRLADRDVTWLTLLSWTHEADWRFERCFGQLAEHAVRFPRHRIVPLCNTEAELARFAARGVPAILANANCVADERVFVPRPGAAKRWDAVHTAALIAWKRHELAAELPSVLLLYHPWHGDDPAAVAYARGLRERLPRATFFNGALGEPGYRILEPAEIAALLPQARVGLCLSAVEGTMFASIEALLCGLPVVSTPSVGGRDRFFDPRFVRIVEPDAASVAAAVRELAEHPPDPAEIRAAALERILADRARVLRYVQRRLDAAGQNRDIAAEWPRFAFHRMMNPIPVSRILADLGVG